MARRATVDFDAVNGGSTLELVKDGLVAADADADTDPRKGIVEDSSSGNGGGDMAGDSCAAAAADAGSRFESVPGPTRGRGEV